MDTSSDNEEVDGYVDTDDFKDAQREYEEERRRQQQEEEEEQQARQSSSRKNGKNKQRKQQRQKPRAGGDFEDMEIGLEEMQGDGNPDELGAEPIVLVTYKPFHADLDLPGPGASASEEKDELIEAEPPEEEGDNPAFCFLCEYGQLAVEMEMNREFQMCLRFMEEQFANQSARVFTGNVQKFYNWNLRPCIQKKGQRLVWRKQTILEHVYKHVFITTVVQEDTCRTFREVMHVLRDNGMFLINNKTGQKTIDSRLFHMYVLAHKHLNVTAKQLKRNTATL